MTSLVLRKVRSEKMAKLKGVPVVREVIGGGVVKLERARSGEKTMGNERAREMEKTK